MENSSLRNEFMSPGIASYPVSTASFFLHAGSGDWVRSLPSLLLFGLQSVSRIDVGRGLYDCLQL